LADKISFQRGLNWKTNKPGVRLVITASDGRVTYSPFVNTREEAVRMANRVKVKATVQSAKANKKKPIKD
jgi:hypothetical protein